jgi:hypothetical protein
MTRIAQITGTRHNEHALGIMTKIRENAPEKELGKGVFIRVSKRDLPGLRALVTYLEALDDC